MNAAAPVAPPQPSSRECAPRTPARLRARLVMGVCALLGLLLWGGLSWAAWASAPQAAQSKVPASWGGLLFSSFDAPWPSAPSSNSPSAAVGAGPTTPHGPHGITGAAGTVFAPACTSAGAHAVGSSVVVAADQWVCGDVNVYGGDVTVLGRVSGAVQVVNGNLTVEGEVDGNVTTLGGDIHIVGQGRVLGKAQAWGGQVYAADAFHAGAPDAPGAQPFYSTVMTQLLAPDLGSLWLSLLFWACASLGFATLLPQQLEQTRAMARRRPLVSLFFGLLIAALAAIASVVLVVTCLGIPIALLLGLVVVVAWVMGTLALGAWVGERMLRLLRLRRHATILPATVLGVLLLAALKAIPYVGLAFGVVIGAMGLGAATLTLLSARRTTPPRRRRSPRAVVPQIPQNIHAGL
ncbi:MAG TPA: hypothetical protein VMV29_05875 [Ktedonobacterales bacterium]|nr:hypothetical protein [Ktedonobacterales bacterium]